MPLQKTTREEIIRKSIQVFRRRGYYRTNMSDLARETGLTKGAFYHHFTSKEDVMRQALRTSSAWFDKVVFSLAYDEGLPEEERLNCMTDLAFQAFSSGEGGCFFSNTILETAHVEDSFLAELNQFFGKWEDALRHLFQNRYQGEALRDVVRQTIADIEGSIILMQLHRDPEYLQGALERARRHLSPAETQTEKK